MGQKPVIFLLHIFFLFASALAINVWKKFDNKISFFLYFDVLLEKE